jgi:hypothetical protein
MNSKAVTENARTLAAALGINEGRAAALLDITILVTANPKELAGTWLAQFLEALLSRTVASVLAKPQPDVRHAVEVVVGGAKPVGVGPILRVEISSEQIVIGTERASECGTADVHPVLLLLGACYAAACTIKLAIGEALPMQVSTPLVIKFADVLGKGFDPYDRFEIGTAYLAGAGAVGNGFLFALKLFDVGGELNVADADKADEGNLNRCVWFSEADVDKNKAERLVELAQPYFSRLRLRAHPVMLQKVPAGHGGGPWLERLIVGVDSRRARRNLQNEFPHEVYDASTTDIREVVLHFNRLPNEGLACMSCVYALEKVEQAHERHVAESLGVSLAEVQQIFVSSTSARKICERYTHLKAQEIEGTAYDSLFKQVCAEGALKASEDRQIFAPFSFVSVLAGVYLAVELLRRVSIPAAVTLQLLACKSLGCA